jgi:hypothetical protein
MKKRRSTVGSAVLIAALGFFIGLTAPAFGHEASHLIDGGSLRPNSVTGKQVKESTLGVVPRARRATSLPMLRWHPIKLAKGAWKNYGQSYLAAAYAVDAEGIVHLRGAIKSTEGETGGGPAFVLPASLMAKTKTVTVLAVAGVPGSIQAGGASVLVISGGIGRIEPSADLAAGAFTSLDGITFASR